jgi:hypothetical protein
MTTEPDIPPPGGVRKRDFWGYAEPAWKLAILALLWVQVAGAVGYEFGTKKRPDVVYRAPADDDLLMVNGCVISACQYLASVRAKHDLEKDFWSRVMLVRYENNAAGHAYCIWETDGLLFGYDRNNGGWPIATHRRDAKGIAEALAVGLGKAVQKPMIVSRAEFIEPAATRTHAF